MDPQELIWAEVSIDAQYALLYFGDAEKAEGDAWTEGRRAAGIPYSDFITCVQMVELLNKASWLEHTYNFKPNVPYYHIKETKAPIITGPVELKFGENITEVSAKLNKIPCKITTIDDFFAGDKVIGDTEDADELMAIFGK